MIIEGNPAGSVGFWSKHLLREDTNDRVTVHEIRGLMSDDLPTALREMEALASGSRSQGNFMYQANINPQRGEVLTPEQWQASVDLLEKNLGLEGHQRVVIEHEKHGRPHYHVVWNRVDADTLRVADMGGNWYSHERTARELEQRFGLEPTPRVHGEREGERPERKPELWEIERAERSKIDPAAMKAELTELWNSADSGKAFAAALDERGYVLAKGDRRDFCIVDQAGDAHSLARRLDGVKAKDVRERMADIDRDSLPSVAEARDEQRARFSDGQTFDRDAAARAWENRVNDAGIAHAAGAERDTADALRKLKAADRADNVTLRAAEDKVFWKDYRNAQDTATAARVETWAKKAEADRSRIDATPAPNINADAVAKPAVKVLNAVTGIADKLVDFIDAFFSGGTPPPPADQVESIIAQRKARAALEHIRESLEHGRNLSADDVRSLPVSLLSDIREKGDDGLRAVIHQMERDEERRRDWGRERER